MMCDVIQVAKIKFMCMCHDATFSLLVSIFTPYYARYMIRTTSIHVSFKITDYKRSCHKKSSILPCLCQ